MTLEVRVETVAGRDYIHIGEPAATPALSMSALLAREVSDQLQRVLPAPGSHLTPAEAEVAGRIARWVGGWGVLAEGIARGITEGRWKESPRLCGAVMSDGNGCRLAADHEGLHGYVFAQIDEHPDDELPHLAAPRRRTFGAAVIGFGYDGSTDLNGTCVRADAPHLEHVIDRAGAVDEIRVDLPDGRHHTWAVKRAESPGGRS